MGCPSISVSFRPQPKLVRQCTLPITGIGEADMIVIEYGVFVFEAGRLVLRQIAPEITVDELRGITDAEFDVSADLHPM